MTRMWMIFMQTFIVLMIVGCAKTNDYSEPRHHISRRATNTTNNNTDDGGSFCNKTCTLIIVASVLSIFLLCLICAVYCASSRDDGSSKRNAALARYGGQRRPVSLNYFNEAEEDIGTLDRNPRHSMPPDNISGYGSNFGYNNDSYYDESIHEQKVRDLHMNMGWEFQDDQDNRDTNDGQLSLHSASGSYHNQYFDQQFDPKYYSPKRNRYYSSSDIYQPDEDRPYGVRTFSLDLDDTKMTNGETDNQSTEENVQYSGGRAIYEGELEFGNEHRLPVRRLPQTSYANEPPLYRTLPPRLGARKVLPSGPTETLKSVLKRSISFQEDKADDPQESEFQNEKDVEQIDTVPSDRAAEESAETNQRRPIEDEEARQIENGDEEARQMEVKIIQTKQTDISEDSIDSTKDGAPIVINNNDNNINNKNDFIRSQPISIVVENDNNQIEEIIIQGTGYEPDEDEDDAEEEHGYEVDHQDDSYRINIERTKEPVISTGQKFKEHNLTEEQDGIKNNRRSFKVEIENLKNGTICVEQNNNYHIQDDDEISHVHGHNRTIHVLYDNNDI